MLGHDIGTDATLREGRLCSLAAADKTLHLYMHLAPHPSLDLSLTATTNVNICDESFKHCTAGQAAQGKQSIAWFVAILRTCRLSLPGLS